MVSDYTRGILGWSQIGQLKQEMDEAKVLQDKYKQKLAGLAVAGATRILEKEIDRSLVHQVVQSDRRAVEAQLIEQRNAMRAADEVFITSTGGGITKVGAGTLTLSNHNSYTGATSVAGGCTMTTNSSVSARTSRMPVPCWASFCMTSSRLRRTLSSSRIVYIQ